MSNIFWSGYSGAERPEIIERVRQVVSRYGDVVNYQLFSDISITMMIEIQECRIDALHKELAGCILLDKFESLSSTSLKERVIYLHLTFTRATGNLKVEVPSVPG